tara:strand:- start:511 stop:1419 length:909 start_codon:yes stop_codon:yes gene_type:complete
MAKNVVLKQSDIDVQQGSSYHPTTHFESGSYGAPVYHATFTNPITNSGDWSRGYAGTYNDNAAWGMYTIKSSVDSGKYAGPLPTNRNYSFRAWMRVDTGTDGSDQNSGIGLCLKVRTGAGTEEEDNSYAYRQYPAGYTVWLRSTTPDENTDLEPNSPYVNTENAYNHYLIIATNDNVDGDPISSPTGHKIVICGGGDQAYDDRYNKDGKSYKSHKWHRVRADVIQAGGGGDTINVYTSSAGDVAPGSEVWELVGTKTIQPTDSTIYMDPDGSNIHMGWCAYANEYRENRSFISNFEIIVEDT